MMPDKNLKLPVSVDALAKELSRTKDQLREAMETLEAIRTGSVDAVVVDGPVQRVFTLEGAEHPYRIFVETMNQGAATITPEGMIVYCNRAFTKMLNAREKKVIGSNLKDFVAADNLDVFESVINNGFVKGSGEGEVEFVRNRSNFPAYISSIFLDKSHACLTITDLSLQKQAKQVLISEQLTRSIIDQAGEAIVVCDSSGIIVRASRLAHILAGTNPLLKSFQEVFNISSETNQPFFISSILRGEVIQNSQMLLKIGQETVNLFFNARPLLDISKNLMGCVISFADITRQRHEAKALEFTQFAVNKAEIAICYLRPDLGFDYVNDKMCVLFGFNREEFGSLKLSDIVKGPAFKFWQEQSDVLKDKESSLFDLEMTSKQAVFDAEVNASFINLNEMKYLCLFIKDISLRKEYQKNLRSIIERNRRILESINEIYFCLDSKWRFKDANANAEKVFKARRQDLIDKVIWQQEVIKVRSELYPYLYRSFQEKRPLRFEIKSRFESSWYEGYAYPFDNGLEVYLRDISDRKVSEEKLRDSEQHFRALADNSPDVISRVDSNLRHIYVSPSSEQVLGISPDKMNGKTWRELGMPEEQFKGYRQVVEDVFSSGKSVRLEIRLNLGGREKDIEWSLVPEFDKNGIVQTALSIKRDITGRKAIEKALQQSEVKFKSLAENSPSIIMRYDKDLTISYICPKVEQLTGKPAGEFIGKRNIDVGHFSVEICKIWDEAVEEVFKTGRENIVEFEYKAVNSAEGRSFHLVLSPGFNESGQVEHVYGVSTDITESKKAHEVLVRDKRMLEHIVNEKTKEMIFVREQVEKSKRLVDIGMLSATVAHELRNPLAAIKVAVYNLQKKVDLTEVKRPFLTIESKLKESDQIINNLLFYSRLKTPDFEQAAIYDMLRDCSEMLISQLRKKRVNVIRDFESVKGLTLQADSLQLKELIANVTENAFDAVDENGTIEISARNVDNVFLSLKVKDNGCGIERSLFKKIWEPFFSLKSKGTGLGLSVCSEIVRLHNGTIDVDSKKGGPTTMQIRLPLKQIYSLTRNLFELTS